MTRPRDADLASRSVSSRSRCRRSTARIELWNFRQQQYTRHDARCTNVSERDPGRLRWREYVASSARTYCLGTPRSTTRITGYLDWSLGFLEASHFSVSVYPAPLVRIGYVDRSRAHDAAVKSAVARLGLSCESIAAIPKVRSSSASYYSGA